MSNCSNLSTALTSSDELQALDISRSAASSCSNSSPADYDDDAKVTQLNGIDNRQIDGIVNPMNMMRPLKVGDRVSLRFVVRWGGEVIAINGRSAQVMTQPFGQADWYDIDTELVGPHNTGRHP